MKKVFRILLSTTFALILALGLSSCGECKHKNMQSTATSATCTEKGFTTYVCSDCNYTYVDNYRCPLGHNASDWITDKEATCKETGSKHTECTVCEEVLETISIEKLTAHTPVTDPRVDPTFTTTGLTEGSHCSICEEVLVAQNIIPVLAPKASLTSTILTVDGQNIYGVVDCYTAKFDFSENVCVTNDCGWIVMQDGIIENKIASLSEGDNSFYIHIVNPDQTFSAYKVNIYRKHLYKVEFKITVAGLIPTQYVEEGCLAQEPAITLPGYTFFSWDYDFSTPITSNITVNASWKANEDTPYKVEYYLENVDKNGYDLIDSETQNLTGTTDTTVRASRKTFEHFELEETKSNLTGRIKGDGSTVLKLYYERNSYIVTSSDTSTGTVSVSATPNYDKRVTISAVANKGYAFIGWYSGDELVSDLPEYTFNIDRNVVAKFDVLPEMQGFFFESTPATCTITGIKDKSVTEITIPEFVTSIGESAFKLCTNLTSITIPNSVTSIGDSAFYSCKNLASVSIPNSVTSIGICAFDACTSLASVKIPASIKIISEHMFSQCTSLTSITIPDGITSIGAGAFSKCSSLKSVAIPDSVTSIDYHAFSYCSSLKDLDIPDSVTSIGIYAFYNCTGLTSLIIPSSVTSISDYMFEDCTNLVNVTIPNSVTSIGKYAFSDCKSLAGIDIPNSVTSIGIWAFYRCTGLVSVTIPDSVTSISDHMFYCCQNLKTVTIPDSVTSIDIWAFAHCTNRTSVTIPTSVISIGNDAFYKCTNLTNVTIPDGVTSLSNNTFYECTGLKSVTIPTSVTIIGYSAFFGCDSLSSVYYKGTREQWGNISIDSYNHNLANATCYYYSESEPVESGNYWYYDKNGKITVWK